MWGSLRYQTHRGGANSQRLEPKTAQHFSGTSSDWNFFAKLLTTCFSISKFESGFRFGSSGGRNDAPFSDSGSSSSSSDSSDDDKSKIDTIPQKDTEVPTFDEAIYARHRRVIHAMLLSEGDNSSTKAPDWRGRFWRAARGSGMNGSETQFKDEWANCTAFCQHLACRKCGQRLIWPEPGEKTFSSAWRQGFSIDFCSILFVFIPTFFLLCRFTCLKHNWVYSLLKLPCNSISGRSMNRNKARCIFFSCHAVLKVR